MARHGLLVGVVLAGAALLGTVSGPGDGDAASSPRASVERGTAPYGVAGCRPSSRAAAVDVAVTGRALSAGGGPASRLAGSGPAVGASVRDLAGYAAEGVAPCDVVQVTLNLHDPSGGGSVAGTLQAVPHLVAVADDGGRGQLVAVDWSTWAASLPAGSVSADQEQRAAWFVTLVDPVPGTYRLTGRVAAQTAPTATGDVEVLVEVSASPPRG